MVAQGAGEISRHDVGTPVFARMIAASAVGLFVIPMLYVTFQSLRERSDAPFHHIKPRPWMRFLRPVAGLDRVRRNAMLSANEVLVDEFAEKHLTEESDWTDKGFGDPKALRQAANSLPVGQRTAIELVKFRELSLTAAASVTGMSISALKVSVHRAIKTLRHALA